MRLARTLAFSAASLACASSLAACSNSKTSTPTTTPTPASSPSPSVAASPPSGVTGGNLTAVQQCLKAAGITLPSAPAGAGGSFPAGASPLPGGSFPAGGFPSGAIPSGGAGGAFNNPQAQEALKACGITLPSAAPTS